MDTPHTLDLSRLRHLQKIAEELMGSSRDVSARARNAREKLAILKEELRNFEARKVDFAGSDKRHADIVSRIGRAEQESAELRGLQDEVFERSRAASHLYENYRKYVGGAA